MKRHIGQIYLYNFTDDNREISEALSLGTHYVLAQVEAQRVALVGLESGNRWNAPVTVKLVDEISETEWEAISECSLDGDFFSLAGSHFREVYSKS